MIRPMQPSDIPRVAEIHVFGWRCAYRGIVSDEILFNRRLVTLRAAYFESALLNNEAENYVFDDGIIKAFMTIGVCRDADKPGTFELCGIYVEPLMKRQGIGTQMAAFCEREAIARGYKEICLWVLEENDASRRFYEKLGYEPDGAKQINQNIEAVQMRYTKLL